MHQNAPVCNILKMKSVLHAPGGLSEPQRLASQRSEVRDRKAEGSLLRLSRASFFTGLHSALRIPHSIRGSHPRSHRPMHQNATPRNVCRMSLRSPCDLPFNRVARPRATLHDLVQPFVCSPTPLADRNCLSTPSLGRFPQNATLRDLTQPFQRTRATQGSSAQEAAVCSASDADPQMDETTNRNGSHTRSVAATNAPELSPLPIRVH